jgi:glutamate-ammonia-ligase adenylyltransferase
MRERLAGQFPDRGIWDVKLAPGGLVDIEFLAQTLQLCCASSNPSVLDQNTIAALERLCIAGAIPPADAAALIDAAKLEHALTQVLRIAVEGDFKPEAATKGLKSLLMRAGDAPDFTALEAQLAETEMRARAVFDRLIPAL